MHVAEIAVRFGDTPLSTVELATGAYRIGTAPGVDLAVPGLTSFPLVEWTAQARPTCLVRVPVGVDAHRDGLRLDGGVVLSAGDRLALTIGAIAIEIGVVERAAPLPRPAFRPRFAGWVVGALLAHLGFLAIADALADPEAAPVRLAYAWPMPQVPEPPIPEDRAAGYHARRRDPRDQRSNVKPRPRAPVRIAVAVEALPEPTAAPRARAVAKAREAGILGALDKTSFAAIIGKADLVKELSDVGPIYREDEAAAAGFGGGARFVPAPSVPVGRYATVSSGRAVGDRYALPGEVGARRPPRVTLCSTACTSSTGEPDVLRAPLVRHEQAILGCYERNGGAATGDIVVDIAIANTGKVIHAEGEGLGKTGSCVAGVIRRVRFDAPGTEVTARVPMAFDP